MSIKEMLKDEIDKLPEDILSEVLDFVKFLELSKEKKLLIKASQELSMASFNRIWDNDEDSIYDDL